jgi:hypothetical protein
MRSLSVYLVIFYRKPSIFDLSSIFTSASSKDTQKNYVMSFNFEMLALSKGNKATWDETTKFLILFYHSRIVTSVFAFFHISSASLTDSSTRFSSSYFCHELTPHGALINILNIFQIRFQACGDSKVVRSPEFDIPRYRK